MSTIPAVIAALVTLGRATLSSDTWQVIDGPGDSVTTQRERVLAVADEEFTATPDYDSFGGASMSERYTVPLVVSVSLPGPDTLATARTEAFAAHEAIRDALLGGADRSLGLGGQGVREAVPNSEWRVRQFATESGRSVAVRFGVDVYAQLI